MGAPRRGRSRMDTIVGQIARELEVGSHQVEAAVRLLAEGATVPFIARYRKEATGGLTDAHLRLLEERLYYLQELEERRAAIFRSLDEQGKLTPELHEALASATTKARLEDFYLPFRPKRRSRGQQPAGQAWNPSRSPCLPIRSSPPSRPRGFVTAKGIPDVTAALDGARWILMDQLAEDPDILAQLREYVLGRALIESRVVAGKQEKGAKFADYFAATEPVRAVASHRVLAMFRGRKEGVLRLAIVLERRREAPGTPPQPPRREVPARRGQRRSPSTAADRAGADDRRAVRCEGRGPAG